ncbi:alanine:cation symporter family protein, partial [Arthrospira platensis SPKY1]|nr:alanine:cation symporter family protein [Arthrospira platensis SPKY1]
AILMTDVWQQTDANGVTLTLQAFESQLGTTGTILLVIAVMSFAFSSLFAYSWYGRICTGYLIGAHRDHWYNYFYVLTILVGAVVSMDAVVNLIDSAFALMAIPTMVSTIWLAPKVHEQATRYFNRVRA